MKRVAMVLGTLLLSAGLAAPALSAPQRGARGWSHNGSSRVALGPASSSEAARGVAPRETAEANLYRAQGYLVPDQAVYERSKAEAAARAGVQISESAPHGSSAMSPKGLSPKGPAPLIASGDPDIGPAWTGVSDPNVSPPDTTGAIGTSRYIELINDQYGIYDRSGNVLAAGGLQSFASANTDCVTDPQIMWDPQTNRFYYVVLEFSHTVGPCNGGTNTENRLYIGWSKTASPSSASFSSWCKYVLPFFPNDGDILPDYPKLGDNSRFLLIGSNNFDSNSFEWLGADVTWITKPGAGTGCPIPFANHLPSPLQASDLNDAFTPVPANQSDTSGTGYVVAASAIGNTFIDVYPVSTDVNNPVGSPVAHTVAPFSPPSNAPQAGTTRLLDTLEGRLTNAVSGFDPFRGKTAVWTQHTVAGGAGAEVRWYELDPGVNGLLQPQGAATDGSLFAFNAAISPDRKVSGSTKRFGDAMVLGFNTSSTADFVRIQMVSKWANNAQSEFVEVKASPGFNEDFSCGICRWGDYSGASPDPASNQNSNHGRVWLSNQWNVASTDPEDVDWRTYVWATNPAPYVVLNGPTSLFQKGTKFPVSWLLGNQASVADVRYRRAPWNGSFGGFTTWKSMAPAGGATFTGAVGNTYCFSAQSYDDTSSGPRPWGFTSERCAVVPLDDRNLSASSGWSRLKGSGFYGGTYTRSTTLGKSLTRTGIHARRIYVMVEKCSTCGSIKLYWNGSLKHTYSLHAGSTQKKVYLLGVSFGSVQTGTFKIVVSSSGKPVIIDALAVSAV